MTLGGLISGFFGGLSGHQGALRSAFLLRYQLSKEVFIGSGIAIACMVDITRLFIYLPQWFHQNNKPALVLILLGIIAACSGAYIGNKYLKKVDVQWIKWMAAAGIIMIGVLLMFGIL